MATSSSSADHQNLSFATLPCSRQLPSTSSPSPTATSTPSPSPPVYTAQPLPSLTAKTANQSSPQMSKLQPDPSGLPPAQAILYPVASSGRGFIPKTFRTQSADQLVTVANPGGFAPRSVMPYSNQVRPLGFPPADPQAQQFHGTKPPILQPSQPGSRLMAGNVSGTIKSSAAVASTKVAPFPSSSSEFTGLRDISRDDTVVTVHDRKVRLSDGASPYALCRSWVRNGLPKETQTQLGDGVNLLPRPLPTPMTDTGTLEKSESDDEDDDGDKDKEEDEGSVEHLSTHELLLRHVKRAKRVRARLRKERLQRIERYKQRLALLLPSSAEHFRSDIAPGS